MPPKVVPIRLTAMQRGLGEAARSWGFPPLAIAVVSPMSDCIKKGASAGDSHSPYPSPHPHRGRFFTFGSNPPPIPDRSGADHRERKRKTTKKRCSAVLRVSPTRAWDQDNDKLSIFSYPLHPTPHPLHPTPHVFVKNLPL